MAILKYTQCQIYMVEISFAVVLIYTQPCIQ